MKMDKLLALYPQAQKKTLQHQKRISFLFAIDDAFIWIKQDSLSQQENQPFESVIPCNQRSKKNTHGITIFLKMLLVFKKSFRLIQLHVESKGEF